MQGLQISAKKSIASFSGAFLCGFFQLFHMKIVFLQGAVFGVS